MLEEAIPKYVPSSFFADRHFFTGPQSSPQIGPFLVAWKDANLPNSVLETMHANTLRYLGWSKEELSNRFVRKYGHF